jgi:hypothetical protein
MMLCGSATNEAQAPLSSLRLLQCVNHCLLHHRQTFYLKQVENTIRLVFDCMVHVLVLLSANRVCFDRLPNLLILHFLI